MIPDRVVLATRNRGKIAELAALVRAEAPVEVLSLDAFPDVPEVEEQGSSYAENAIAKARAVAAASGVAALADDSGLEVEALGGAPGLRSARYAGPSAGDGDRIAALLRALAGVPAGARRARFRCVLALAWPDGAVVTADAECPGDIAVAPEGSGGFGYDPVFVPDALGRTFAAASATEKLRLSHRARAMAALFARLRGT